MQTYGQHLFVGTPCAPPSTASDDELPASHPIPTQVGSSGLTPYRTCQCTSRWFASIHCSPCCLWRLLLLYGWRFWRRAVKLCTQATRLGRMVLGVPRLWSQKLHTVVLLYIPPRRFSPPREETRRPVSDACFCGALGGYFWDALS